MGIDVVMYLHPASPVTPDEVKRAAVRMQIALGSEWGIGAIDRPSERGPGSHSLQLHEEDGRQVVTVQTYARYYGPHYTRGPGPAILNTVRYLRHAFPGCELHYGGDCSDDVSVFTEDDEREMWALLFSDKGYSYFSAGAVRSEGTVVCDFCEVRTNAYAFGPHGRIESACPSCRRVWRMEKDGTVTLLAKQP